MDDLDELDVEAELRKDYENGYLDNMPPMFESLTELLLESSTKECVPRKDDCVFTFFMHLLHKACLRSMEEGEENYEELRPQIKWLIRDLCSVVALRRKKFDMDSYSLSLGTIRSTLGTLCMVVFGYLIQFYFSTNRKSHSYVVSKMRQQLKPNLVATVPSFYEDHEQMQLWSQYECDTQLVAIGAKWYRLDASDRQLRKFVFYMHMQCQACWVKNEDEFWRDNCCQMFMDMYMSIDVFWAVDRVNYAEFMQIEMEKHAEDSALPKIFLSRVEGNDVETFFRDVADPQMMHPFLDTLCSRSMDDTVKMHIRDLYMQICLRPGERVIYTRTKPASDNIPTKRILSHYRTAYEIDIIREHSLATMYSELQYKYGEKGYWMDMLKYESSHVGALTLLYLVGQWIQSSSGHDFIHESTLLFPHDILQNVHKHGNRVDIRGLKWPYIVRVCGHYYVLYGKNLICFPQCSSRYEEENRMSEVKRVIFMWFLLVCKHIEVDQFTEFYEVYTTVRKFFKDLGRSTNE